MKYLKIVFIVLLLVSCSKEKQNNRDVIEGFIEEFYLNSEYNLNLVNDYMAREYNEKYSSLTEEKKKIHEQYIKSIIDKIREVLKQSNHEYNVIISEEIDINRIESVDYGGSGEVYYLLSEKNELVSIFIIHQGKILTFCTDIYNYKNNKIAPYFFFEKLSI